MKRMLVGTTITGRMYGICIGLQNWIVDRRHFLGGLQYFAVYKNGLVLCQGSLLFSRLQVNFQRRRKNVENQNSRLCCSKFLNCKACLQNEYRDFLRPGMMCQTSDITMLAETPAVSASNAENSTMVLQGKDLVSAIFYEAERGYTDAQGRTMRFSDFLYSRLLPLCFPSIHKSAKGLSEEVKNYSRVSTSDRLELLNKVSVLLGYDNIHALIGHERALRESSHGLQGNVDGRKEIVFSSCLSNGSVINPEDEVIGEIFSPDESDVLLACQKFPSIVLGSSPLVDLYIPTKEDFQRLEYPTIENSTEDSAMLPMDKNGSCIVTETQRTARDDSNQDASHLDLDAEQKIHTLKLDKQYLNLPILDTLETTKNAGLEEGTVMASTKLVSRKPSGKPEKTAIPVDSFLDAPIGTVRCVGPIQRRRLDENGFHTVRKLLHHFPRTYVNLQDAEGQIEDGQYLNFFGRILSSRGWKAGCSLGVHEVIVACQIHRVIGYCSESSQHDQNKPSKSTVYLHLKRFFRGARFTNIWILNKIQSKYHEGDLVSVSGKVKALEADDHFEIREFNLEVLDGEADLTRLDLYGKEKPCPVYPSKGTLDPKFIGDCIRRVLQVLHVEMDPVPDSFCKKYNLMGLCEAYYGIHCPKDLKEADRARRRFVFDEFFYLQLRLLFQRFEVTTMYNKAGLLLENSTGFEVGSLAIDNWSRLTLQVMKSLPFSLTTSQLKVASEIFWDLRRPFPMSRLLQGDVGCGKTVVAFLAALEAIHLGYQAAFMVPTELLAMQHYECIVSMLERINEGDRPSVALLTGSSTLKQAHLIRKGLESGDISLVVGTHSLISESVKFASLGFAVTDEQHRFGVVQRGMFNSKVCTAIGSLDTNVIKLEDGQMVANKTYFSPHVLVMSATPIPRTLALAFHGDMSLSQINESPPGRIPVKTFAFHGNTSGLKKTYQMVQKDLDSGGRVFLVYPAIEESEQLPQLRAAAAELETISNLFKDYKCGLLHGRMRTIEKQEAMQQFKAGETQILLSTQVIEVGIDIPEASMIVIMNAERFGMAQLHQLRGRVGRGTREATCILLSSSLSGLQRLKILEQSTDGFYLAEADLHLRGPGNLLGSQQSGHLPQFSVARLEIDGDIMEQAHLAAMDILQKHHCLDGLPRLKAELSMRHPPISFGA